MPPVVALVPIYLPDSRLWLQRLGPGLERAFGLRAAIRSPWFDPEIAFDASRGQYRSTVLLERLLHAPGPRPERVLGVAGVDLFVPVLTYVFGEAQLGGRAAVVSLHRLRNEHYGLPADDRLLARRAETEAVHELGHTYGLVHCAATGCVMHASTYVEEIDFKTPELCEACRALLPAPEPAAAAPGPEAPAMPSGTEPARRA